MGTVKGSLAVRSSCHATPDINITMEVLNPVAEWQGHKVEIELQSTALLKVSALVYMVPATA